MSRLNHLSLDRSLTSAFTPLQFCTIKETNAFLSAVSSTYGNRWRDFGILFGFM